MGQLACGHLAATANCWKHPHHRLPMVPWTPLGFARLEASGVIARVPLFVDRFLRRFPRAAWERGICLAAAVAIALLDDGGAGCPAGGWKKTLAASPDVSEALDLGPGGGARPAEALPVIPLPPTLSDPSAGMQFIPPAGLGGWLESPRSGGDGIAPPAIETVAKPLEEFVTTPWKSTPFAGPKRPGLVVRQASQLPWGIDAEWRVGVAVDSKGPGRGEIADATNWTIRKAIADDFFLYLHDRGSGFVKHFGERVSVFGRYITSGDHTNPVSTVQFGAAKSY
ncbi:MAG: hypothetical protein DWH79_13035 [Planctomycetota bacterium]|nr:MAG: hypothetical protein DWH79_13035 [Planctomycetota bacterium]